MLTVGGYPTLCPKTRRPGTCCEVSAEQAGHFLGAAGLAQEGILTGLGSSRDSPHWYEPRQSLVTSQGRAFDGATCEGFCL